MKRNTKQKLQYLIWRFKGIHLYAVDIASCLVVLTVAYIILAMLSHSLRLSMIYYYLKDMQITFWSVLILFVGGWAITLIALGYETGGGILSRLEKDILSCIPWKERRAALRIVKDIVKINKIDFNYRRETKIYAPNSFLSRAVLENMDLRNSNFKNADLHYADLRDSKLSWSNFDHANMVETNMRGADLAHANLQCADLTKADLSGATLWGANLDGAILVDTKLKGADLTWAQLEGASVNTEDFIEDLKNWKWSGYEHVKKVYFISQEQTDNGNKILKLRRNLKPIVS